MGVISDYLSQVLGGSGVIASFSQLSKNTVVTSGSEEHKFFPGSKEHRCFNGRHMPIVPPAYVYFYIFLLS